MDSALPPLAKTVVGYAENISKTLLTGGGIAASVVVARILGQDKIKIHDFEIPLGSIVVIVAIGTVAHIFWARFIILGLHELADDEIKDPSRHSLTALFNDISGSKSLFLNGLIARNQPVKPGSRMAKMSVKDPTTWLSHGLAMVIIVAILPWRIDKGFRWLEPWWVILEYAAMALIFIAINWWIGGLWITMLSLMKDDPQIKRSLESDSLQADYYDKLPMSSAVFFKFNFPAMARFWVRERVAICGFVVVIGMGLSIIFPHLWDWILLVSVLVLLPVLVTMFLGLKSRKAA
jgi:hypothetical protein